MSKDIYIQRNLTYRQRRELLDKRARGSDQNSGADAIPIATIASFRRTSDHQAEISIEAEFPNHNRNSMSVAQQNYGTHDQSLFYYSDSSRDDSSRDS